MPWLELKIPPPVVTALCALAMWGVSLHTPLVAAGEPARLCAALLIALAGFGFLVAGVVSFRLAKTTVNPLKPETATALVRSGVYRITRNPMYVGFALLLVAWAVYLASLWTLLGPLVQMAYITRFQILPEERALTLLFGAEFTAYRETVRRWL